MTWPSLQDYNEAIQSPKMCFSDPELRAGAVECNQLGLPRPRSGAFATVYKLSCGTGTSAVKCFNREVRDQQARYAAISSQLNSVRLQYTVNFNYLPRGILVKGRWLPILKMEWVVGEPLNSYVERHLYDRNALFNLARNWVKMLGEIGSAGIAHGDLQDGNVLVVGSDLKLVDYDGMYVPALQGSISNEIGQPNYQHPSRTAFDFGPFLDNFSGWVILLSLLTLGTDPSLWKIFKGGDQCLLFRKLDFEAPQHSALFRALEKIPDQQIRAIVTLFKTFLHSPLQAIPPVDGSLFAGVPIPVPPTQPGGAWIQDHIQVTTGILPAEQTRPQSTAQIDWVLDFTVSPVPSIRFDHDFRDPRLVFYLSIGVAIFASLMLPWMASGISVCLLIVLNVLHMKRRYYQQSSIEELRMLQLKMRDLEIEIINVSHDVERAEKQVCDVRETGIERKRQLVERKRSLQVEQSNQTRAINDRYGSSSASLFSRRRELDGQEAAELGKLQSTTGRKVADLKQQLATVSQTEVNEKAATLKNKQDQYVLTNLKNASIWSTSIPGIGPGFKERLGLMGFLTAAEMNYYNVQRVPGIGRTRASVLTRWKQAIEAEARSRMPKTLGIAEARAITQRYSATRLLLETELNKEEEQWTKTDREIRERYSGLKRAVEIQISAAQQSLQAELTAITTDYGKREGVLDGEIQLIENDTKKTVEQAGLFLRKHQKKLSSLQWRKGKLDREANRYRAVSFTRYVRRLIVGV